MFFYSVMVAYILMLKSNVVNLVKVVNSFESLVWESHNFFFFLRMKEKKKNLIDYL